MTMNDLTAPLGQDPRRYRRAMEVSAAQIIALALGLFFGAFVLWALTAENRSGGEPVAVAPADMHIAKKAPEVIAVPQTVAPAESTQSATTATPPPAPAKSAGTVTVTIVDGKTGAKREVIVSAPPEPPSAEATGQLPSKLPSKR
ncbi:MAG: hypothetical protein J2P55_04740 [Rhizobiales bacterium]|nr:hypothetical protein [Hyphomicrobiales bacterium]